MKASIFICNLYQFKSLDCQSNLNQHPMVLVQLIKETTQIQQFTNCCVTNRTTDPLQRHHKLLLPFCIITTGILLPSSISKAKQSKTPRTMQLPASPACPSSQTLHNCSISEGEVKFTRLKLKDYQRKVKRQLSFPTT